MSLQSSGLPLYLKNGKALGISGGSRLGTKKFLIALVVTFVLAWVTLIAYLPEVQHSDVTFENTYQRFVQVAERERETKNRMEVVTLSSVEGGQETEDQENDATTSSVRSEENGVEGLSVEEGKASRPGDKLPLKEILQFDYGRKEDNGDKETVPSSSKGNNSLAEIRRNKVKEVGNLFVVNGSNNQTCKGTIIDLH